MKVYADAVEKAKADCDKLMFKARQGKAQIEDAKVNKSKESVFLLLSFTRKRLSYHAQLFTNGFMFHT